MLGMRTINGIIVRCLRSTTYCTVLSLHRRLCGENPMASNPTENMVLGQMVGAACGPDKVGSSQSYPLWGVNVVIWCRVGYMERRFGRRPCVYLLEPIRVNSICKGNVWAHLSVNLVQTFNFMVWGTYSGNPHQERRIPEYGE